MNNGSSTGNWDRFLHSDDWKRKRGKILRRDSYIDQYVLKTEGRTISGGIVHHILPKEKFPQYALTDWNLITVSDHTHRRILHNRNGDLTKAGRALMLETAELNGILLRQVTMVIGLPGAGKTTWTREHLGSDGLAYDLDAIAMAFRLKEPHSERHVQARKMANALFRGFALKAQDFSPNVFLIRTPGNVEELSIIRPDRLVILRGQHRIEKRPDFQPVDIDAMEETIEAMKSWCESNGILVEEIPPHE